MPWALELYLDEQSTHAIQAAIPQDMPHPHLSLSVAESIDAGTVHEVMRRWSAGQHPISVVLDHWGMFVGESVVLFLAPRDRAALQAVHEDFHRAAQNVLGGEWSYYRPHHWVPHCTVADRVAWANLGAAASSLRGLRLPCRRN